MVLARHENVNQRVSVWDRMRHMFRHDRRKHNLCFEAVAVIELVQIKLQNGDPVAAVCLEYFLQQYVKYRYLV